MSRISIVAGETVKYLVYSPLPAIVWLVPWCFVSLLWNAQSLCLTLRQRPYDTWSFGVFILTLCRQRECVGGVVIQELVTCSRTMRSSIIIYEHWSWRRKQLGTTVAQRKLFLYYLTSGCSWNYRKIKFAIIRMQLKTSNGFVSREKYFSLFWSVVSSVLCLPVMCLWVNSASIFLYIANVESSEFQSINIAP